MDNETPSRVMYDDLKTFGHISRKDVAQILLSDRVVAGGRSLRTRALEDPTYVTRYICDATPGALSARILPLQAEGAFFHIVVHIVSCDTVQEKSYNLLPFYDTFFFPVRQVLSW